MAGGAQEALQPLLTRLIAPGRRRIIGPVRALDIGIRRRVVLHAQMIGMRRGGLCRAGDRGPQPSLISKTMRTLALVATSPGSMGGAASAAARSIIMGAAAR